MATTDRKYQIVGAISEGRHTPLCAAHAAALSKMGAKLEWEKTGPENGPQVCALCFVKLDSDDAAWHIQ